MHFRETISLKSLQLIIGKGPDGQLVLMVDLHVGWISGEDTEKVDGRIQAGKWAKSFIKLWPTVLHSLANQVLTTFGAGQEKVPYFEYMKEDPPSYSE
jgi:hypothetical protein